jgi:2-polyprenyl-3-methyl-5-hydroxy-6-metoxy-1,4-benzoquinol methylase
MQELLHRRLAAAGAILYKMGRRAKGTGNRRRTTAMGETLAEGDGPLPAKPLIERLLDRRELDLLRPRAGERVLDVGCGEGGFTRELARAGASVVGVDRDGRALACRMIRPKSWRRSCRICRFPRTKSSRVPSWGS